MVDFYVVEVWHKKSGMLFERKFFINKQNAINYRSIWNWAKDYWTEFYDARFEDKEEL